MAEQKKLDRWAEKLLDTGKRNNLINYKDTKASSAEVLFPGSDGGTKEKEGETVNQREPKFELRPMEKGEGEIVIHGVDEYEDLMAPPEESAPEDEDFVLKIEDENGTVIAGCVAEIYNWGQIYIDILWVDEKYRRHGLGSLLLREAERRAIARGCRLSHLGTFDFQARPLYEKHGYAVFSVNEDFPAGHTNHGMWKRLDREAEAYIPSDNSAAERYEVKDGTEEDGELIEDGLVAHNASFMPFKHEWIRLNNKFVDEDGRMIAGVAAGVGGWDFCFISGLWVEEAYRGRGLGSALLRETERLAKENGAYMVLAEAYDWNLAYFKERGYRVLGALEGLPKGHCYYELKKLI